MPHEPVELTLRSRQNVWVRPVRPDDAGELQRAFALLSDLSRYQRFLTGTPRLTDDMASFFSTVDHKDHEALVALPTQSSREIIGVARFIRYAKNGDEADLAITVADQWHGKGLGSGLLDLLSTRAREENVRRFTVDMLATNTAVRALVSAAGGHTEVDDGSLIAGHIDLTDPIVVPLTGDELLRRAATGSVAAVPYPLGEELPELRPVIRATLAP